MEHSTLPKPLLKIVEPKAGRRYSVGVEGKQDEGIQCIIRVEVPQGGKVPEAVIAQLLSGGLLSGSSIMNIKEKDGPNTWVLEGTLSVPARIGNYKIRAEGIQTLIVENEKGESEVPHKITRVQSPEIEIKVGK
ncbi:hypothetical protein V5E97_00725 [Singulisphaera sp. Ch08]|uniref:Uncharacterized protein n=1 Tax=Singulisphaera sp. Ch08 TaxID=3120278 RepID=A0AAU7CGG3_9BACT